MINLLRLFFPTEVYKLDRPEIAKRVYHALIQSDSFVGKQLHGTIAELGATMGRKQVRTGDPAEKSDRDVLEVLIDLAPSESKFLVVGLRVTVQFLALPPLQK